MKAITQSEKSLDISQGNSKPRFLITIDTEGDNLWAKPTTITTRNTDCLPRFQSLCESYDLKPTYLTNYEMANCLSFQEFGRDILKRNTGEVGMHLHAWNSPPLIPLTADDFRFHPYLIEYPENTIREKISVMTNLLEDVFSVKMVSHRAGRWSFDETYAQILIDNGYRVDCSVTPHISWKQMLGDPGKEGGTDFSQFPGEAYFVNLEDISSRGDSSLLEIPVTITLTRRLFIDVFRAAFKEFSLAQGALNRFFPRIQWLRPNGRNLDHLLAIVGRALNQQKGYVEFMLHSSELMPGGSPTFRTSDDIEALYCDLEALFSTVNGKYIGATLDDYYQLFQGQQ